MDGWKVLIQAPDLYGLKGMENVFASGIYVRKKKSLALKALDLYLRPDMM